MAKSGKLSREISNKRAARVKQLCQLEGITQSKFAEMLNMQQTSISEMIHGRRTVTDATIETIHNAFPHYSVDWLLGYGIYRTDEDLKTAQQNETHFQEMLEESRTAATAHNLTRIIKNTTLFEGGLHLVTEPYNMEQLYKSGYITEEDYRKFQQDGVLSEEAEFWLERQNEYVIAEKGKFYHIPQTVFYQLAEDVERYALFRMREYFRTRNGGITNGDKQ